jgi:hypothetical protein
MERIQSTGRRPMLRGSGRQDATPGCQPQPFEWSETTRPLISRLACAKACEARLGGTLEPS